MNTFIKKYLSGDFKFINVDILQKNANIGITRAKAIMAQLTKDNIITKIKKSLYIFNIHIPNIDRFEAVMLFDGTSYISTYSILERNIIKQAHTTTFAIYNKKISKNDELLKLWKIDFTYSKIPMTFGIYIKNKVRWADTERALLDLIYLHIFNRLPITSELYLQGNIDEQKIKTYLQYYPKRVSDFYYLKLNQYEK